MKVCNLGTITHLEDIMQMSDYICTEAPLLIIVPAFDRIKRSLQEISIHLFRAEQEKASQAILFLFGTEQMNGNFLKTAFDLSLIHI